MKIKTSRGPVLFCFAALSVWSSTPDSTILRIQSEIAAGKFDVAQAEIKAALRTNPQDGGLYNLRGIVHANRNEIKAAAADFAQAVHYSPRLAGAYLNLGRAGEMLGTADPTVIDQAIEEDRHLLHLEPNDNEVRLQLADMLQQRAVAYERDGQLTKARDLLEIMASLSAANPSPLVELARIAQRQKDFKGALGYLAHARDLQPESASVHFFFGIVCIELDLPVEAKKSLDRALDLDPGNAIYNYARGSVELQGKSAWQAIPYFKKFVAAYPDDQRGHFALGVAEFASQDYEVASQEMTAAAATPETAAGAQYFLGRISKADGDWAAAAEHLRKSIEVDSAYADSHAELGLALLHLNNLVGARKEIDQALALNPDSYIANGNLLTLFRSTKDPMTSSQEQRLRDLDSKRSEKQELLIRTIEISRYAN